MFSRHRLTPWPEKASGFDPPHYSLADGKGERADPDTLHLVYTELLKHLPLLHDHQKNLRGRGLKDGSLLAAGYRTLGRGRRLAVAAVIKAGLEKHLPNVPGFFVKEEDSKKFWTITQFGGMLIPVGDTKARIVALLLRADGKPEGGKYRYLSSKPKGGAGPSSPIHVPRGFDGDRSTIRVTEGALKADIATKLSNMLTIGLPGVNAWKRVPAILRELGATTARLAFDADAPTNKHVADALANQAECLREEGFPVELERWHGRRKRD
jgi:hypothetical protein